VKLIIDTNVLVVANRRSEQASPACVSACASRLASVPRHDTVVIDAGHHILREYVRNARSEGQPGVGDAFLKWVLTNRTNPGRCEQVIITLRGAREADGFAELPDELQNAGLDRSDCKFIAVALAHPDHPPILNAVDSDWWHCQNTLARHGITVDHLCPDAAPQGPR
jgi:hypothetical protein